MMMIGVHPRPNSTPRFPLRDPFDDPMAHIYSPHPPTCAPVNFSNNGGGGDCSPFVDTSTALHRYLPSNEFVSIGSDSPSEDSDVPVDAFSCDQFRIYEFKVRKCARGRSHDWTECPYAHPGEKARRRDPRRYHYSGTACPEFRKGSCRKGDSCEFAHGVFECWLHPARYRTQPCKDGPGCRRRVCFFAHSPEQLRVFAQQNPKINGPGESYSANDMYLDSPTSVSPPPNSSPTSPSSQQLGSAHFNSVSELAVAMRNFRLGAMETSPPLRGFQLGSELGSPRNLKQCLGFRSLPSTPTQVLNRSGLNPVEFWEQICEEEEPVMERVESGRDLRAKIYAKLRKQNSPGFVDSAAAGPDVEWVSELVS